MTSLMKSLIRRPAGTTTMRTHTVGNALVLHLDERIGDEAQTLALGVAADPEHDIVVLDLPGDLPIGVWDAVATALPRRRRPVRLLVCGRDPDIAALGGQWLAERLGRPVVAPHGRPVLGAGGVLFTHPGPDSGWVRYFPHRPPLWEAKRFPRPLWDPAIAESTPTSATGVADPLPGGVWIHDSRDDGTVAEHRDRLIGDLPCLPDTFTVVLGRPGTAPLSLDDVDRFWRGLDGELGGRARFLAYGPLDLVEEPAGQALADRFRTSVVSYAGLPGPVMRSVTADGRPGWRVFARELRHQPRAKPGDRAATPDIISHDTPLDLGEQVSPRVYWYAHDAVVEVVQSGLWMRPVDAPRHAGVVRGHRADPAHNTVVFEDGTPAWARRMRELAEDIVARLDTLTRRHSRLVPSSELVAAAPAAVEIVEERRRFVPTVYEATGVAAADVEESTLPMVAAALRPAPTGAAPARADLEEQTVTVPFPEEPTTVVSIAEVRHQDLDPAPSLVLRLPSQPAPPPAPPPVAPPVAPVVPPPVSPAGFLDEVSDTGTSAEAPPITLAAPAGTAAVQPTPASAASALLSDRGLDEERRWLRRTLAAEFDATAGSLGRVLSQHPGLHGSDPRAAEEILADAVAIRFYLSERGVAIDAGLRSAVPGPHVPIARCVVAGLTRLPSHRGATTFTASPTAAEWKLLESRRVFTDWGFVHALTEPAVPVPGAGGDGEVDVLIWSMTARRTRLLEPDGATGAENRVLFVPGTSFKLLEATTGDRRRLLLRELATDEIGADGRVDGDRGALDDLAVATLTRAADQWSDRNPSGRIGPAAIARFGALPGLTSERADGKASR